MPIMVSAQQSCPCGTTLSYGDCCGPLLDGRVWAATAEQLMRSRYTAYAVGHTDHVFRTWQPRTRPASIDLDPGTTWLGLTIVDAEAGGVVDEIGVVEFAARFWSGRDEQILHERSRFSRRAGRWMYLDGDVGQNGGGSGSGGSSAGSDRLASG